MFRSSKRESSSQKETGPPKDPFSEQVLGLYSCAYRGLYRPHAKLGTTRLELLNALCGAAGATAIERFGSRSSGEKSSQLGPLDKALSLHNHGSTNMAGSFQRLRVHRDSTKQLKDAVVEALEAYNKEVKHVEAIETALRERQLGFREPTLKDWHDAWDAIEKLVDGTGNRLMHYHAKLVVLQLDLERDIADREMDEREEREGWMYLRHLLEPPKNHKTFLTSSI